MTNPAADFGDTMPEAISNRYKKLARRLEAARNLPGQSADEQFWLVNLKLAADAQAANTGQCKASSYTQ